MQLKITHIHGQIGIRNNDAVLSISQPRAEMKITTQPSQVNIKTNQVRVKIDQQQCFSEAGLKDIFELTEEFAQGGKSAALEAVGNIVDEGNRMARIDIKEDALVELAASKALPSPAEINIAFIPQSRPKIEVEGGVSFDPEVGKVNISVTPNAPEISATQPSVDIYLAQKPDFHFEFVGNNVDVWG